MLWWPLPAKFFLFYTHVKLCLAIHNFQVGKNYTYSICLIWDQTFTRIIATDRFISQKTGNDILHNQKWLKTITAGLGSGDLVPTIQALYTTIIFFSLFYRHIKSLILGLKCVFEHENLQMFGPKLNNYE